MQQVQFPESVRTTELVGRSERRHGIISVDPETMGGTPCFAGTRIPIKHLWDYLEGGGTIQEFMEDFEGVPLDQCIDVLRLARERLTTVRDGQIYEVATPSEQEQ